MPDDDPEALKPRLAYDYFSMLGLKLNYVSEGAPVIQPIPYHRRGK